MWVVKLGGSLSGSEQLPRWLDVLACYGGGQVVIVPGGGPFADAVRQLDARWGLSDHTAHRMAVRAMEQYGDLLTALRDDLRPAADEAQLREVLGNAQVAVWMPTAMVLAERTIPATWAITSDSIAAWLAARLGADGLLLVKSVPVKGTAVSARELAARGVVDDAFPEFLRGRRFTTRVVGCSQYEAVRQMLYSGVPAGVRVTARRGGEGLGWQRPLVLPAGGMRAE